MRRLLPVLALLVLLAGCDLKNRESSAHFIPSGPRPTQAAETQATQTPAPPQVTALPSQAGGAVKTVLDQSGTYAYADQTLAYRYRLPYIDLPGAWAMACNREIDDRFLTPAQTALADMEAYQPVDLQTVDYTADVQGPILTLRLYSRTAGGGTASAVYSVLLADGTKVPGQTFLDQAGLSREELTRRAMAAAEQWYAAAYGSMEQQSPVNYRDNLDRTLDPSAFTEELPMYLTEDGRLTVIATVYDLSGAPRAVELVLGE